MKTQIKSILIPTDFSYLSESALKVGVAIARRQNADLTLLYVADKFQLLHDSDVFLPNIQMTLDFKLTMEEKLKELSDKIQKEANIKIRAKVLEGNPSDSICQFAHDENISLIVMGTHGTSGLRQFFIGTEAFRVVKNATCPVLTIPGNWSKTDFKKVIFPIRLISEATDKYDFAKYIIEKNNSELILLGLAEVDKPNDINEVANIIDKFKLKLQINNIVFQTTLCPCENFPVKVLEIADKYESDLIILTANFDFDFKAFFVGTYVQKIVNRSMRPVLSIKSNPIHSEKPKYFSLAEKWGNAINFSELGLQV